MVWSEKMGLLFSRKGWSLCMWDIGIKETVYQHLANEIFFCILHEEYALGAKLPSYIDLAKKAGSSPEIVRKVSWESQRQGIKDKREVS